MSEDIPSLKRIAEPRSLKPAGVTAGYRRVRTKGMWAMFGISLILLILGVILLINPPMSEHKTHVSEVLEPQEYTYWKSIPLDKGEQIVITGTVKGGNNDIWIYVKEYGQKVKDFGRVESPVHVVFTAPERGNYSLYISNELSLVTSKSIDLNVIFRTYDYGPGASLFVGGIIAVLASIVSLALGQKRFVVRVGNETYEFWSNGWWKFGVAVNGVTLDAKVKPGDKFRIGSNDEHVLEVKKLSWRKVGFFVDGREVGRLP